MWGGRGGENGRGSASGSILAASAGLGRRSAAVPGLLIRLLPDPRSRGKILKYHRVHHRSLPRLSGIMPAQVLFKEAVSCDGPCEYMASRLVVWLTMRKSA